LRISYKEGTTGIIAKVFALSKDADFSTMSWNVYKKGEQWEKPGGDFDEKTKVETKYAAKPDDWEDYNVTEMVKGWISEPSKNKGFILVADENPEANNTGRKYYSSENSAKDKRPQLVIDYKNSAIQFKTGPGFYQSVTLHCTRNRVTIESPKARICDIFLFDAKGKMVESFRGISAFKSSVPLHALGNGVYSIAVATEKFVVRSTVTVMR